ncbi:DUF3987 domain-containing protein [Francisella salina]|uniref:DUF3987 domain-containing protein n=1 Tax=Francisella salina TaxID=573569 RepID=A0ABM5M8H1_FRAST|nr:DUF3987 domain-containing protein [Francisella salina]AEI35514.1 hypothetical protein F7308_0587 [Francisella salina]
MNVLKYASDIAEPKPLPLPSDRKELPIFNIDCLPKVIADYVNNLANAMQQPRQYIATSCLVSIAGLLGNKVCLDVDDRKAYPILWGMLIGDSGTGKTPSINEPMQPIKEIDKEFVKKYKKAFEEYSKKLSIWKMDVKDLESKYKSATDDFKKQPIEKALNIKYGEKPIKPYSREICINTATKEALLSQLADDSPNGLILEIDELMDFIHSIIRTEKVEDHKLYVEAYNCGSFKDKTQKYGTKYVDNITIHIIGGVQTQRLLEFTNKYNGSGLLARFQLIPIAEKQQRTYKDIKLDFRIKSEYLNLLNKLKNIPQRFNIVDNEKVKAEPKKCSYTNEAKSLYIDWFNKNEKVKNESGQSDLMIEYLGKANNTFHALALIYHLADNHDNDHINKEVVQKVITTLEYFYNCADYLYGYNFNKSLDLAKKIVNIKTKLKKKNGFSIGDVTRETVFRKLDKELVQEALDILEQNHHIKKTDKKGTKYTKYDWL